MVSSRLLRLRRRAIRAFCTRGRGDATRLGGGPGFCGPALASCRLRRELARVGGCRRANEEEEQPSDGQAPAGAEHRVGDKGPPGHRRPLQLEQPGVFGGRQVLLPEDGKFSYQLILDNGAQEDLIMPTADDAKVLRDLFHDADTIYWDTEKQVLIFGKIE